MKAILVDDELPLLYELKRTLVDFGNIEIIGVYDDPAKALSEAADLKPELAFLDIEMPGLDGFSLAERLTAILPDIDVLFITAYNHYATEAFSANALDYMLKPVRPERLAKAMERVYKKRNPQSLASSPALRIQSFGHFDVYVGDEPVKWNRSKQRELFAYLLHNEGHWVDKYRICDDLWYDYDPDQALAHLQTAIWAVRKLFRELGSSAIRIEFAHDCYMLVIGATPWDRREFDTLYLSVNSGASCESLRQAAWNSSGSYLSQEDWLWAVLECERYARRQQDLSRLLAKRKD
jgi:two-component SAPR family response regulator